MANITSIKINGIELQEYIVPVHLSYAINGEKNGGGFEFFNDVMEPYPAFTKCQIDINGESTYWYIQDEVVKETPHMQCKHIITLIDPIQRLQGYYMPNLMFTQPLQSDLAAEDDYYNYLNAIQRVFAVVPLRTSDNNNPTFFVDYHLGSRLQKIRFPESFPFQKNLLEFLLQIGRNIAAVPYMIGYNTVSFRFLDDDVNQIENIPYENYRAVKKSDQYCTNIDTTLENLIPENDMSQGSIVYPSENGWISFRTKDVVKMTEESKVIELPYPIHKLIEVKCKSEYLGNYYIIDLTKYCIEGRLYNLLNETDKLLNLYYNYGGNFIQGFFYNAKVGGYFSDKSTTFKEIVKKALQEQLNIVTGIGYTDTFYDKFVENSTFQIKYIPLTKNLRVQIERQKDDDFNMKYSFAANQTDNLISSQSFGRFLRQNIERIGKELKVYTAVYNDYQIVPKVGSKYGDYYLVETNNLIWNNIIESQLIFSKDYSAVSERFGLNSIPRFTELPADGMTSSRSDVYKEHCTISKTNNFGVNNLSNNSLAAAFFIGVLCPIAKIGMFENEMFLFEDFSTKINACIVETYKKNSAKIQSADKGLLLPIISNALGNSLIFNFRFKDNYSAGRQIKEGTTNECIDVNYNEKFADGRTLGRFEYLKATYINNFKVAMMPIEHSRLLPELSLSTYNNGGIWMLNKLIYKKDASEVPSITYQLNINTDKDIILGDAFTQKNFLINNNDFKYVLIDSQNRYFYSVTTKTFYQDVNGNYLRNNDGYYYIHYDSRRYSILTNNKGVYDDEFKLKQAHPTADNESYAYVFRTNTIWCWDGSDWYDTGNAYGQYYKNSNGAYLRVSKDARLVKLINRINKNHAGKLTYDAVSTVVNEVPGFTCAGGDSSNPTYICFGYNSDPSNPPTISEEYQAWAIVDESDNLIIGGNYRTLLPIYFNFSKEIYEE